VIAAEIPPAEIYLKARINGQEIACLLDTGCERSVISRKLIPHAVLEDLDINLYAANGTVISILGVVRLTFEIAGMKITTDFVVTEALEELILGVDWLTTNRRQWNFSTATLTLHGQEIELHRRTSRAFVRRIYVASDQIIPPRQQVNMPVKLTINSLRMPDTDWVMESKSLRQGVTSARTLLEGDKHIAAVPIINCSNIAHRFRANECIGYAEPAKVCTSEEDELQENEDQSEVKKIKDALQKCSQCEKRERKDRYVCQVLKTKGIDLDISLDASALENSTISTDVNQSVVQQSSFLSGAVAGKNVASKPALMAESVMLAPQNQVNTNMLNSVARLYNVTAAVTPLDSESSLSLDNIRDAQNADESISPILTALTKSNNRPSQDFLTDKDNETRAYWAQWSSLTVQNGVLYRKFSTAAGETKFLQLIVPHVLREKFIEVAHEGLTGGHFGTKRTQDQVQRRGYWVGWRKKVDDWCKRNYNICNQLHRGKPPRQGYLKPLEVNGPMDRLHLDLCGPFPRSNGFAWIMTCLDAYTRYLIAVPLKDKSALTVADALVQNVFCRIGLCRQILSDLGPEFQNDVIRSVCHQLKVRQLKTTS
jgi:predicted aspartyl protease